MPKASATTWIFGYGSLLNHESLRATIPGAFDMRAAYIKGFRREFCLWAADGYDATDPKKTIAPYCAVDVHQIKDQDSPVNGVVFEVHDTQLPALLERETGYVLLSTEAYDFGTNKPIGKCFVFSANKHDGTYEFGSTVQLRYLNTCLQGAKDFGEKFYEEFMRTTYIGRQPLSDIAEIGTIL